MQLKSNIKIGILFTLIILIFIGGYIMFRTLNHNKQVFEKNIEKHIPSDAIVVVKINNEHDFSKLIYFLHSDSIIDHIKKKLIFPIYLITKNHKQTILAKVTSQQEEDLKDLLESKIFPYFSPKVKKYKNFEILLYTTLDNSFYTCTFFDGIFAGSYDYGEVQSILDSDDTEKSFFMNKKLKTLISNLNTTYPANLFIVDKHSTLILNAEIKADSMYLKGKANIEKINTNKETELAINTDSIVFSSRFFSIDNSTILPINIYSNSELIFNNNVKSISSYLRYENNKIDIQIIVNKN